MTRTLFVGVGVMLVAGSQAALLIDSFNEQTLTTNTRSAVGTDLGQVTGLGGVAVGGLRTFALTVVTNNHPRKAAVYLDQGQGAAIYDAPTAVVGGAQFWYGFDANFGATPLNLNVAAAGGAFKLDFLFNDNPALNLKIEVETIGTGVSTSSTTVMSGVNFSYTLAAASFTGAANFNDIDTIKVIFDAAPANDFALDNISVVPEPASLLALGLGAAALLRRRR